MSYLRLTITVVLLAASVRAMAQERSLQPIGGRFVSPRAMARISPRGELTSPWHALGEGGISRSVCSTLLCFDSFEPDGGVPGEPTECYAFGACGMGSSRWFFGTSWLPGTLTANDMEFGCTSCNNSVSERIEFAWYWGPCPSSSGVSPCLVAVFTTEDWADCTTGPGSYDGTYSGVVYDFGPLSCNTGAYFYSDVENLCDFGLFHQLPLDGHGGYLIVLAQGTSGGSLVLAEGGQCMLWGTVYEFNPDYQGIYQYDDDNPRDGVHNFAQSPVGECYDYEFGSCPDPLCAMVAFYNNVDEQTGHAPCSADCVPVAPPPCVPCDVNCDGAVDGFDIEPLVELLIGIGTPCAPCAGDMDGDGQVNGFDVDPFVNSLTSAGAIVATRFTQIDFNLDSGATQITNSGWGRFELTFVGALEMLYLNLNVDGRWEIQNIPVGSIEGDCGVVQQMTYAIGLGVTAGTQVSSVLYGVALSDSPLGAPPALQQAASVEEEDVVFDSGEGSDAPTSTTADGPTAALSGGTVDSTLKHNNSGFPNQECGKGKCGPVAVSNSLNWLIETHDIPSTEMGPDDVTPEKMEDAVGWTSENGASWRSPSHNWAETKSDYMTTHGFPIKTSVALPSKVDSVGDALDADKDVEIHVEGHVAAVVGIEQTGEFTYTIDVAHDTKQGEEGGTTKETVTYDTRTGKISGGTFMDGKKVKGFVVEEYVDPE
ncbi:MAG: hypothetical protein CHACPFDD_04124 [Phycisphaerae bacterium]|nr:hypothetical protein [Phycisphaerae bacterium]